MKNFACKTFQRLSVALAAALALYGGASAQTAWPDKPVTVVVPFAAGGPTDVVARMLAIPMGKSLGQSVLVENAAGAGGTIAAARVARSPANGYTVFLHHMGMATAPALYKKLTFDPLKDFRRLHRADFEPCGEFLGHERGLIVETGKNGIHDSRSCGVPERAFSWSWVSAS